MKKRLLEFIPKHKANIDSITPLAAKRGQTDTVPAVDLGLTIKVSNDKLAMLRPKLRGFLFEKTGKGTGDLIGVDPVSDLPNLTLEAQALGALDWEYEQTGCKLIVYQGNSHIALKDCTVKKVKLVPQEGGGCEISLHVYTEDIDEDTMGHLCVLKAQERDIELSAPEIVSLQKTLDDAAKDKPAGNKRQTPAQALAATLGQTVDAE